jgi:hypothetical protein
MSIVENLTSSSVFDDNGLLIEVIQHSKETLEEKIQREAYERDIAVNRDMYIKHGWISE